MTNPCCKKCLNSQRRCSNPACECHKSADNTAERHAIGHILRQPPKEEPKLEFPVTMVGMTVEPVKELEFPTDTAGKLKRIELEGVGDNNGFYEFSSPTDTSEEWKGRFDALFVKGGFVMDGGDPYMKKELAKSFIASEKQRSFEEGRKYTEAADKNTYMEAYEIGKEAGHAAALSKVKDMLFTDDPECEHGFNPAELCKNVHCEIRFRRDLLDHLKTIE